MLQSCCSCTARDVGPERTTRHALRQSVLCVESQRPSATTYHHLGCECVRTCCGGRRRLAPRPLPSLRCTRRLRRLAGHLHACCASCCFAHTLVVYASLREHEGSTLCMHRANTIIHICIYICFCSQNMGIPWHTGAYPWRRP
jgi:hypothetical protein